MSSDLSKRLVPDELWASVEPLLPAFTPRRQGGGTAPVDERAAFTAVVFVLTSGCSWRALPPAFGVSVSTAHRRFLDWTATGLWYRLHHATARAASLDSTADWTRAVLDAAARRAAGSGR